ncbi:MAG: serine protease [Gammaproteobacteria bacterium]|nr:serine protease [Gammaproteobacteria bacterium]
MRIVICLLLIIALEAHADARQIFSPDSPTWMAAVGKLEVPGQKWENGDTSNYDEHCTATLIGSGFDRDSHYILSAWHCLEYYRDLSKPILFSLPRAGITREAFIVASGGGMSADWALLRLRRPVSLQQAQPLPAYGAAKSDAQATLTMAGYSADENLGQAGAVLTYDAQCQQLATTANLVTTDCTAFKGASGGPVVVRTGNSVQILGVISAGDSRSRSLYVPTRLFVSTLRLYLPPPS